MRLNHGLSLLFLAAFASANLTSEYDHTAYLDSEEKYKLYWSVNDADKSIDFAVEVHTTGWVGFGISAGLSGSMKGADIVIGWVDSQGKGHLQDYHGQDDKNGWPILDKKQDYNLVGASESNSFTVLKFKRKLVTCDKEDRDIPLGTSKVIFAFGKNDVLNYHSGSRGARSLNLLSYVKNSLPPKSAKHFDALNRNVLVPAVQTTFWCQAFKVADLVTLSKEEHIIEIEPIIGKKDKGVVVYMMLYVCKDSFNEAHLNDTGSCISISIVPSPIEECLRSMPMYAWAAGGVNLKFPDHVGWPIGAKDSMKYFVLQTHFDNPTLKKDWVVTSGLRFYYDKPRKYNAGLLSFGESSLTIPPKQENWTISGACMKSCTLNINQSRALPGGEIKLFALLPLAHSAGRGIWTKLVRDGKEIMEIIRDDNYDFDYQQTRFLRKEVSLKAGDEIINYCRYNTMNRKDALTNGFARSKELCFNFIMYYPKVNISVCSTGNLRVATNFDRKYGNVETFANMTYFKDWTGVKWNKTMVDELKALYAYPGKDAVFAFCSAENGARRPPTPAYLPTIKEPLPSKKDVCAEGNDHRNGTNPGNRSASSPMINVVILVFMGILIICELQNA